MQTHIPFPGPNPTNIQAYFEWSSSFLKAHSKAIQLYLIGDLVTEFCMEELGL